LQELRIKKENEIMGYSKDELAEILKNPDLKIDTTGLIPTGNAKSCYSDVLPVQTGLSGRSGKYNATRTEYNGVTYPSKHEAQTAQELDLQIKAGEIDFYLRQVNFPLPGCVYRADFVTFKAQELKREFDWDKGLTYPISWKIQVVESKGYPTPEWKRKLRLFKTTYPNLELKVV
jgi:hypothetical protein